MDLRETLLHLKHPQEPPEPLKCSRNFFKDLWKFLKEFSNVFKGSWNFLRSPVPLNNEALGTQKSTHGTSSETPGSSQKLHLKYQMSLLCETSLRTTKPSQKPVEPLWVLQEPL